MRIPNCYLKHAEKLFERDKERFLKKALETPDGCWEWQGAMLGNGYGRLFWFARPALAHRMGYTLFKGDIEDGLYIDHLCCNKKCVNPDHLEAVTLAENTRRGAQRNPWQKNKTHCPRGHEYTPENTYVGGSGSRFCRTCQTDRINELRARRRIENPPTPRGAHQAAKTHCPRGHEYSEENTYVNPKGSRVCLTCKRERARKVGT